MVSLDFTSIFSVRYDDSMTNKLINNFIKFKQHGEKYNVPTNIFE